MDAGEAKDVKIQPLDVKQYSKSRYPYRLNFYDRPPLGDVTLEEFEIWAIDRLRVLAEIEASFIRNRTHEDLKNVTKMHADKYLPLSANTALGSNRDYERLKDHVSHFILRLAFCRSEELKRRFVKAETTLFRVRYENDDIDERKEFFRAHGSDASMPIEAKEKESMKEDLIAGTQGINSNNFNSEDFIKVPWTKVTSLVAGRRVVLKGGMAYVPLREQSSIIFQDFQSRLEKAMDATEKAIPRLDEDDRLIPILEHLSKGFLAGVSSEYTFGDEVASGNEVKAEMIDEMSAKHWPLCMKNLHSNLKREHHLKHYARLQYGLFLKGVGLSIEEAILFWRTSFSGKKGDKFDKDYKYNIRHSYGLEGKRVNYAPKSCQRIITTDQPGPQDIHGCPFRHYAPDNLTLALSTHYGISGGQEIADIQTAVKAQRYHVACTRVFELTHKSCGINKGDGVGEGESVTHPNQYAQRSRELEKEKNEGGFAMDVDA